MEPKDKKQQQDDYEEHVMDSFHPLEPHDPPLLPLAEKQPIAALDLKLDEASRSRRRTQRPQPLLTQNIMSRNVRLVVSLES